MKEFFNNFLDKFGEINFGEINNICMCNFEKHFRNYFLKRERTYREYYDFRKLDNDKIIEFEQSFIEFFTIK